MATTHKGAAVRARPAHSGWRATAKVTAVIAATSRAIVDREIVIAGALGYIGCGSLGPESRLLRAEEERWRSSG